MQNSENYEFDPNFAVICSFLENFGTHIGEQFGDLSIEEFKTFLEANDVDVKNIFVKLHVVLIKGVFGYCKQSEFEKGLIKFCKDFPDGDDKLIVKYGYGKIPVTVKLRILKNLCEDQFEYNDRFNKLVNGVLGEKGNIRHQPVGKDRLGRSYWFMLDTTSGLRLFRGWHNELTRDETWNVVCSKLEDLQELIDLLEDNEKLSNDDPVYSGPLNLSPQKKISPTELMSVAKKDAENTMYFSSIKSSQPFIKSPRRRSKAAILREERKHKLPHCQVKLSRLKESDLVKWKVEPCAIKIEKNMTDQENLTASESVKDLKPEKFIKTEKVACDTSENVAQNISCSNKKAESIIKTDPDTVDKTIGDTKKQDLIKTSPEEIRAESHKVTKSSCISNASVNDDDKIGSDGDNKNDEKVVEGKIIKVIEFMKTNELNKQGSKHADTVNHDLKKLSEEGNQDVISISGTGDASSCLNNGVVSGDATKRQADRNNLINSAENSQDHKDSDKERDDIDSDIFNAAIKDLLTLENKTFDHSVIKVHKRENHESQSEQSDVKTCSKDQEEVDSSDNDKEVLDKALKDLIQLEMMTQGTSADNVCNTHKNGFHDKETTLKSSSLSLHDVPEVIKNLDSSVASEAKPTMKVTVLDNVARSSEDSKTSGTVHNVTFSVSDLKSSESETGVREQIESDVNTESSDCHGSMKDKGSEQENGVKSKLIKKIRSRFECSQTLLMNDKTMSEESEKPITVKTNSKETNKTVSTHRLWSNIHSADNGNDQSLNNESEGNPKISIPNKFCDGENNAEIILTKVMNIIHNKDGNETVKDQNISKTDHKEKENPDVNNVDDIPDIDKDVNLMVGDEMIRIEIANNSSSDEDGADSGGTSKASDTKKDSINVVNSSPMKIGLNAEKAAVNSLYTTSSHTNSCVTNSVNVQSKTLTALKNQLFGNSQKFVIPHGQTLPLQRSNVIKSVSLSSCLRPIHRYGSVSSTTRPIQRVILPAKVPISVPNRVTLSNISSTTSISFTKPAVVIRPASSIATVSPLVSLLNTKTVPFSMSSGARPVLIGPFNTLPKASNQAKLIPCLVSSASQTQGSLISGPRPQVIKLPGSSYGRIVYADKTDTLPKLPVMKISVPVKPALSSSNPVFTVAGQKPVANFVYVPRLPCSISTNVSLSSQLTTTSVSSGGSTVKLALKKYLEAPVQASDAANKYLKNDQPMQKTTIVIGNDGIHYNAATNEPIVYPDYMRYVVAGPGGKFYDKQTGYLMDLPSGHNFKHIPGKVYLATGAKFANGIPKTRKKTKKKKVRDDDVDTSDEEFEKMLAAESDEEKSEKSEDDNYDYEEISKRVKRAKNLKLPSRRTSVESRDDDSEMDVDSDLDSVPVVLGRNAKRVAAKQLLYYNDKGDNKESEESDDDLGSCRVCDSSVNPATILLCDKCDEGYHMSCLSPPLSIVPLENWFCPNCEHNMLVTALKEKLELAKKVYRKVKRSSRSICQTAFSINSENIVETERRSCRNRKEVTYSDEKFDKMVIDAVKDLNSAEKKRGLSPSSSSSEEESNAQQIKDLKTRSSWNRKLEQKTTSERKSSKETKARKKNSRPVRTSRNKTKEQDTSLSSSTKKRHKKAKLTGIDVESSDSGSDYVQSENSIHSDNESPSSEVSESSKKRTYLTLSGRATKNVSYK